MEGFCLIPLVVFFKLVPKHICLLSLFFPFTEDFHLAAGLHAVEPRLLADLQSSWTDKSEKIYNVGFFLYQSPRKSDNEMGLKLLEFAFPLQLLHLFDTVCPPIYL